jgi:hypothetical protein
MMYMPITNTDQPKIGFKASIYFESWSALDKAYRELVVETNNRCQCTNHPKTNAEFIRWSIMRCQRLVSWVNLQKIIKQEWLNPPRPEIRYYPN